MSEKELMLKEVAFYKEMVSGWVKTRLLVDKAEIVIAFCSLVLLLVFHNKIDSINIPLWITANVLWIAAVGCFFSVIADVITIFQENGSLVASLILNKKNMESDTQEINKKLERRCRRAKNMLCAGLSLMINFFVLI